MCVLSFKPSSAFFPANPSEGHFFCVADKKCLEGFVCVCVRCLTFLIFALHFKNSGDTRGTEWRSRSRDVSPVSNLLHHLFLRWNRVLEFRWASSGKKNTTFPFTPLAQMYDNSNWPAHTDDLNSQNTWIKLEGKLTSDPGNCSYVVGLFHGPPDSRVLAEWKWPGSSPAQVIYCHKNVNIKTEITDNWHGCMWRIKCSYLALRFDFIVVFVARGKKKFIVKGSKEKRRLWKPVWGRHYSLVGTVVDCRHPTHAQEDKPLH